MWVGRVEGCVCLYGLVLLGGGNVCGLEFSWGFG